MEGGDDAVVGEERMYGMRCYCEIFCVCVMFSLGAASHEGNAMQGRLCKMSLSHKHDYFRMLFVSYRC